MVVSLFHVSHDVHLCLFVFIHARIFDGRERFSKVMFDWREVAMTGGGRCVLQCGQFVADSSSIYCLPQKKLVQKWYRFHASQILRHLTFICHSPASKTQILSPPSTCLSECFTLHHSIHPIDRHQRPYFADSS